MSAAGPGVKRLFCEGKPESYDYLLLNNLVKSGDLVVPAGGKYGFSAFIEGYTASIKGDMPYLAFRDRDFDMEPLGDCRLLELEGEKPIFLSYRTCIENYFVDANLIHSYWDESSQGPNWKFGDSPGTEKIAGNIKRAAEEIKDYQAIRWALSRLKQFKRWPSIETKLTDKSGNLPSSLIFDDCLNQAKELVKLYQDDAEKVSEALLEEQADHYRSKFEEQSFWDKEFYLIWFHGKDLLKAFQKYLPKTFPRKGFELWAAQNLNLTIHDDLKMLAQKLKKM